jgi:ribonucleoside-diphosphate reductase beta chain
MKLFEERIPYKPFEYPEYYNDGWLPLMQAFWLHTEIPMQSDVKDWKENLEPHEKNLVGNILLGFAQTECAVSDYWTNMVTKWFPKHEIKQMAMAFGSNETIHAVAYSYLNETLGLEDFEAFLHEPAISAKFDFLATAKGDYTHEDLKNNQDARKDVARSLAIFSAFAEGVSLYSSFAILYSFQMRNLLKGIGQQMKWSVRDESLHSKMGCKLFRHMCQEDTDLKECVRQDILTAAELIVEMEHDFIDKMFEMGDLENCKAIDVKNFITRRANEKLIELGYDSHFEYDIDSANELNWFYHLTGGVEHSDFFAIRPTAYSKAGEDEVWDESEMF